jgi:hypothetical protein
VLRPVLRRVPGVVPGSDSGRVRVPVSSPAPDMGRPNAAGRGALRPAGAGGGAGAGVTGAGVPAACAATAAVRSLSAVLVAGCAAAGNGACSCVCSLARFADPPSGGL